MSEEITHAYLEKKAVEFLRKIKKCWVVQTEVPKQIVVAPFKKVQVIMDVVGVKKTAWGNKWYIVEAKVSYQDFNDRHRLKHYRRYPVGAKKYIICPRKVIVESQLRKKGLIGGG